MKSFMSCFVFLIALVAILLLGPPDTVRADDSSTNGAIFINIDSGGPVIAIGDHANALNENYLRPASTFDPDGHVGGGATSFIDLCLVSTLGRGCRGHAPHDGGSLHIRLNCACHDATIERSRSDGYGLSDF